MTSDKCPFEHPLLGGSCGCSQSEQVSKRDGPHVVCTRSAASARCQQLFDDLKRAALPVFDVPDDLEKMPHSVPVKIQYGGLQGLAAQLQDGDTTVADIHALVDSACARFGGIEHIPCADYVDRMTAFKVKRRSR